MTNNLKEEIEKLIVETDPVIEIEKGHTSQVLVPQYYVDRLVDRFYTLINQKEKEARIDELKRFDKQMEYDHYEDVLENRIKQLKEELNKEVL